MIWSHLIWLQIELFACAKTDSEMTTANKNNERNNILMQLLSQELHFVTLKVIKMIIHLKVTKDTHRYEVLYDIQCVYGGRRTDWYLQETCILVGLLIGQVREGWHRPGFTAELSDTGQILLFLPVYLTIQQ